LRNLIYLFGELHYLLEEVIKENYHFIYFSSNW